MFRVSGRQSFSLRKLFFDTVYRDDKSAPLYQVARRDPKSPLDAQSQQIKESEIKYEVSKLPNGVTVLTEQASHPTRVDLGILLNVGARDETSETSGSLLAIKNTYFKTIINTNETINYGVIQMSGGDFEMDYDQETSYFKAHSLSHDVVDVFKTIVDCALEPKSVVSASVAQEKNQGTHKLEEQLNTGEKFNETIFKTAFGQEGLGNPLRGYKKNIGNLSAYTLQKFQLENIHPSKIIVTAGGVYNHQEFVNLAAETLSFIPAPKGEPNKRVQAQYVGGEVRNLTDDAEIAIALLFPSVAWNSNELPIYQVLNTLLGSEGHGQSIIQKNLLSKHSFIDSATGLNFNFSDAGLFGFKVTGSAEKGADLLRLTLEQLKGLTNPIPADQLHRAKSLLKNRVFTALERPDDRLEEAVKSLNIFNAVKLNEYGRLIDSVTSAQINTVVANLLKKTPTLVAEGGLANRLPSYDQILNQLK